MCKLSLQILTIINCLMKNKVLYCNLRFVFQTKYKTFLNLKTKFHRRSYVLTLIYEFSGGDAVLSFLAKSNVILRSDSVNTWEFLHSLEKDLKTMTIMPLKNTFYSPITRSHNFLILTTNNNGFRVTFRVS